MKIYIDTSKEYRISIEYLDFGILKKVETVRRFKKGYQAKKYLMIWHDCLDQIEGVKVERYSWEII